MRLKQLDMDQVKISVVIPFYNVEAYIAECLESVLSQSLNEIEVICVDDCSPDGSRRVVEEAMHRDGRIQLVINEENTGVAVSRNRGMEAAVGEYLYVMDSDDVLLPGALKSLYEKGADRQADIVLGDAYKYYEDGRREYFHHPFKFMPVKQWCGHAAWWFIFRRDLLVKHPEVQFPAGAHPGEDTTFSFMLFCFMKRQASFKGPILLYRQHPNMVMNRVAAGDEEKYEKSLLICADYLMVFFAKHGGLLASRRLAFHNMMVHMMGSRYRHKLPSHMKRALFWGDVRNFFYRVKVTKSGRLIVKICKIPVVMIKLKAYKPVEVEHSDLLGVEL